jgi:hypothetical protein
MTGIITDPIEALAGVEAQGLSALPSSLAQDVGAAFDETITRNPMSSALRALDRELYRADSQVRRLSAKEASDRYAIPGHLNFDSEVPEPVARDLYELKREELRRRDVLERSPGGFGRTSAQLAAGLVGSALDPINLASAFVPVAAPFRMAAQARLGVTGGRAAVGAIEGVAGAAMVEPLVLAVARDEQADYGVTDSLLNLAFGGVLGGGLHVASGAVGDFLARRVAARARAEDVRPSTPGEAIASAVDDLPLEQRQQLLAAAVQDLVDGDSVRRPAQLLGDPAADLRAADPTTGAAPSASAAAMVPEAPRTVGAPLEAGPGIAPAKLPPAAGEQSPPTPAQLAELDNAARARQLTAPLMRPAAGAERIKRADLVELSPSQLIADASRFQFKAGGDEAGVTDRLRGVKQWDQRLAGVVLVYEDRAGKRYIADGHQRLGLAKRLEDEGQKAKLNAIVLREADGYTDTEVMVVAALKNIAEGTGTAIDAAKVFRALDANPDLGSRVADMLGAIPRNSALVRDAVALQALSDRAFGLVVNERVQPAHAAEVGRLLKDPKQQEAALEVLARLEPQTQGEARHIVEQVREAGFATGEQTTLFGKEQIAKSLFLERARIADRALAQLRKDKAVFRTLVDQEGRITQAGNALDRGVNEGRLTDDEKILYAIDRLASRKGPVSDALAIRAGELAAGKRIGQVVSGFVDDVRALVRQGLELDGAVDSPGPRDQAAGTERPATEPTAAGQQGLIAGVAPVTQGDRLRVQADQPLQSGAAQKPADVGLFDVGARNQLDLVDQATKLERAAQEAEAQAQRLVDTGAARADEPELFAIQREQQTTETTARGLDAAAFCINRRS